MCAACTAHTVEDIDASLLRSAALHKLSDIPNSGDSDRAERANPSVYGACGQ
jgi:hypothetical protein